MKERLFGRLRAVTLGLAAIAGLAAGAAVLELTEPPGPGLDPDAMQYLSAAQSIAHGDGLRIPLAQWSSPDTTSTLAHFPPGYSAAIAVGIRAGLSPQNSARLVMAAGSGVAAAAMLFAATEGGTLLGGLLALLIIALTPAMVIVTGSILSEPLFLALFASFVWQLTRPRAARGRMVFLGVLATAAAFVRYAGMSLVGAVLVDAFVGDAWMGATESRERPSLAERARRAAAALAIPVAAFALWSLLKPRGGEIRNIHFYRDGLGDTIAQGVTTVGQWLAPGEDLARAGAVVAIAVAVAVAALIVRELRVVWRGAAAGTPQAVAAQRLLRAIAIAKVCYLGLVGASRLFADGDIPLDERILAPVFVLGAIAIGAALVRWWFAAGRGLTLLTAGIMASWVIASAKQSKWWVDIYREDGGDFASREWRLSPLIEYTAKLPAGTILYSNWPSAIWFHTGRASHQLPTDEVPGLAAKFRAKLAAEHALFIAFHVNASDVVNADSLAARAGLVPAATFADGVAWRAPADSVPPVTGRIKLVLQRPPSGAPRATRPQ